MFIITCPDCFSGSVFYDVWVNFSGFDILEKNGVNPSSHCICRISNDLIINTYRNTSSLEKCFVSRQNIGIQKYFFFVFQSLELSGKNWIFSSILITNYVPITVKEIWQRLIVFFVARFHFLIQIILKVFRILHHKICISIFFLKILDYFRIFSLVHPEIRVISFIVMDF